MRKIFFVLAALSLASPALAGGNGSPRMISVPVAGGSAHEHITLGVNKAAIIQLDADARDVLVSSPSVVDAVVRSPRRIFLIAQKPGETNAFFFDGAGRQLLSLDIRVEQDISGLAAVIKSDLPGDQIQVAALNDSVVLTGSVQNAQDTTRAVDLAAHFTGDPKKVVNMLKIGGDDQVMLKVRIAEVQRQVAKQLGVDLAGIAMAGNTPLAFSTSNPFGLTGTALSDLSGAQAGQVCNSSSTALNPIAALDGAGVCNIQNNLQGKLKALETVGLVRTLAEPNLTAVSGDTATFLAGGEFPVPSGRDQQGNVSVAFKKFGVGLNFTPVVLGPGRISLQISTEVSELTNTGSFTLQGAAGTGTALTIPALAVRRAETTVELPSGGSFAIAGLLQHTTKQQIDAFPGLKDMPVLGALFRSRDFQNNESELVVMVTAYLVSPVSPDKIALPTKGLEAASDTSTILMGKMNKSQPAPQKPAAKADNRFIVQ